MDAYISVEDLVELILLLESGTANQPILVNPLDPNNAPPPVVPVVVPLLPPQNVEPPMPARIDQTVSAESVPNADISEVSQFQQNRNTVTVEIDVLVDGIDNGRAAVVPVSEAPGAFSLGLHGQQAALVDGQQQSAPIERNREPNVPDLPADLLDNIDPQQFDANADNLEELLALADQIVDDQATLNLELSPTRIGTEEHAEIKQNAITSMEKDEEKSDEEEAHNSPKHNLTENLQQLCGSSTDHRSLVFVPQKVRVFGERRIGVSTAVTSTSSRQQFQPVVSLRQPFPITIRRSVRDYVSSRPQLGVYSNDQSTYTETESQNRQSASAAVVTAKSNRCVPQGETSVPAKRSRKRSSAQIEDDSQPGPSGVSRQHKRANVTTVDESIDRESILRQLHQLREELETANTLYEQWLIEYNDLDKQQMELTGSLKKKVGEAKCRANNHVKKHDATIKLIEANTTILKLKLKIDDLQKQISLLHQRQVVDNDLKKIDWQNTEHMSIKRRRLLNRRSELEEQRNYLISEIEKEVDHSRRIPTSEKERSIEADGRRNGMTKASERTAEARRRLEANEKEYSENEREIEMQQLRDRNMFLERKIGEILGRQFLSSSQKLSEPGSSSSGKNSSDRRPEDEGRVDKDGGAKGEEDEEGNAKDLPRATKSKHDRDSKD